MSASNDQKTRRARRAACPLAVWLVGLIVCGCQPPTPPVGRSSNMAAAPESQWQQGRVADPRHAARPVPLLDSWQGELVPVERAEIHAVRPLPVPSAPKATRSFVEPAHDEVQPHSEPSRSTASPSTIRTTRHVVEETAIEPVNWGNPQARLAEASRCYHQAMQLARRGALFAARAQLLTCLEWSAEAQDHALGQPGHREALRRAQRILDEVDSSSGGSHSGGHVAPREVAQAQSVEGFVQALEGSAVGSAALHALGKLYAHWGEQGTPGVVQPLTKARVYLQAACRTHAAAFGAANDLGVLEARQGNSTAAQSWLAHSLTLAPHPTTWQNWSLVQQGNFVPGSPAPRFPQVQWIDPIRFAQTTQPQLDAVGGKAISAAPSIVPQTATRPNTGRWWNQ